MTPVIDEQANANNLPAPIDADNTTLPASYERAKQALAACESIDECKDWEDRAAALAAYGRMAGDTELEKHALRIRAHAARRAGELLLAIPGETGGRPPRKKNSGGHSPEFSDASLEPAEKTMSPRAAAAKDAGMSEHHAIPVQEVEGEHGELVVVARSQRQLETREVRRTGASEKTQLRIDHRGTAWNGRQLLHQGRKALGPLVAVPAVEANFRPFLTICSR